MPGTDYELLRMSLETSRGGGNPGYPTGFGFGAAGLTGGYGAASDAPEFTPGAYYPLLNETRGASTPDEAGPHAGRGPRNYRRSDERIREDVCERLTRHPDIDASGLEIEVSGGAVSVAGTVPDRRTKRAVAALAERVSGVRDVHTTIRVIRHSGPGARPPS